MQVYLLYTCPIALPTGVCGEADFLGQVKPRGGVDGVSVGLERFVHVLGTRRPHPLQVTQHRPEVLPEVPGLSPLITESLEPTLHFPFRGNK